MQHIYRKISAAGLLIAGVGLMQYHSVMFWTEHTDAATGWLWSILLEGAALWLWSSHRITYKALGSLATILVLAGPLYDTSAPLIHEWTADDAAAIERAERRAVIEAEIDALQVSLDTFLANSRDRIGWSARIDDTQAKLAQAREELRHVVAEQSEPTRMAWQAQAVIAMQAIALVLFQLVNVLAIQAIARRNRVIKAKPNQKTERKAEKTRHPSKATSGSSLRLAVANSGRR